MKCKWISLAVLCCMLFYLVPAAAEAPAVRTKKELETHGFYLVKQQYLKNDDCYVYQLEHRKTGAVVVFKDNQSLSRTFSIGFASQAQDNKGANHVLEHVLLTGSEKYPTKNAFTLLKGNTVATMLNGMTSDDAVFYPFETRNIKDYNNLLDVYLDMIFHPLMRTDKNLFLREGIRREYADDVTRYNGVVFNEMRAQANLLSEATVAALEQLYPHSIPAYDAGGDLQALKTLTYEDVLAVYETYYKPSNSVTYLAGDIDLDATLAKLEEEFAGFTRDRPAINFKHDPVTPAQPHLRRQSQTYTAAPGTATVGFVASTAPVTDSMAILANTIVTDLAYTNLTQQLESLLYATMSTGGGFHTLGFMTDTVPQSEAEATLRQMKNVFSLLLNMTAEDWLKEIDKHEKQSAGNMAFISGVMQDIMQGFIYCGDPLLFLDHAVQYEQLRSEVKNGYFKTFIPKYYTENSKQVDFIFTPAAAAAPDVALFAATPQETESIKQETKAFNEWAQMPDSPEILAKFPKLQIADFAQPPYDFDVSEQSLDGVPFIYTAAQSYDTAECAGIHFNLSALDGTQVPAAQLVADIISMLLQDQEKTDISVHTWANANRYDNKKYTPTLDISIVPKANTMEENVHALLGILQDPDFLSEKQLTGMFKKLRDNAFYNMSYYYYYNTYMGEMSDGARWNQLANAESDAGGYHYYQYLQNLPGAAGAAQALTAIKNKVFNRNCLTLSFQGSGSYQDLIRPLLSGLSTEPFAQVQCTLPVPVHSYSLIDNERQEVVSINQIASITDAGVPYSGKLQVLSKLLTSKYLQPQIRGAAGAYGADLRITSDGKFIVSASRAPEIHKVLDAFDGMGNYLRNLTMTQEELDTFIIPAVNDLDESFTLWCSNFGIKSHLEGFSQTDLLRERNEILSATPADMREYADAVDAIIAQKRVFISGSEAKLKESGLTFEKTENLDDITARGAYAEGAHPAYIIGSKDGIFEPDTPLTRAEAAVMLSRALTLEETGDPLVFTDVAPTDWFYDAICKLSAAGIMHGCDGVFAPAQIITGEEFFLIASRLGKLPEQIQIEGNISRGAAVHLMNAILGRAYSGRTEPRFSDVPENHPYYQDIQEASISHMYYSNSDGTESWISQQS